MTAMGPSLYWARSMATAPIYYFPSRCVIIALDLFMQLSVLLVFVSSKYNFSYIIYNCKL